MLEFLKKTFKKCRTNYKLLIVSVFIYMLNPIKAYAAQPTIVSGTLNLLNDAMKWLLILIPAGAGLALGIIAFQKSISDDQAVIAEKNKLMKNVIKGAVIAEGASGIITFILSYYQ